GGASRPAPRRCCGAPSPAPPAPACRDGRRSTPRLLSAAGGARIAPFDTQLAREGGKQPGLGLIHLGVPKRPVRRPEGEPEGDAARAGGQLGTSIVAFDIYPLEQRPADAPQQVEHLLGAVSLREQQ